MPDQKTTVLEKIFSDVLSDLAFMFTDEEPTEPPENDTWIETIISYSGSVGGTLRLRCTIGFALLLASNLLGTDPNDDDAEVVACDAVKEFMNIACGQFVTAVHGMEDVFNLTIPRITKLAGPPDLGVHHGTESATVTVDGHPVQLTYLRDDLDAVAPDATRETRVNG